MTQKDQAESSLDLRIDELIAVNGESANAGRKTSKGTINHD